MVDSNFKHINHDHSLKIENSDSESHAQIQAKIDEKNLNQEASDQTNFLLTSSNGEEIILTPGEKFEESQNSDSEAEHEPDDLKVDFLDNLNLENLLNDSDIAEETESEPPEAESSETLTCTNKRRKGEGIKKMLHVQILQKY